jgi:hypothetical protein
MVSRTAVEKIFPVMVANELVFVYCLWCLSY